MKSTIVRTRRVRIADKAQGSFSGNVRRDLDGSFRLTLYGAADWLLPKSRTLMAQLCALLAPGEQAQCELEARWKEGGFHTWRVRRSGPKTRTEGVSIDG